MNNSHESIFRKLKRSVAPIAAANTGQLEIAVAIQSILCGVVILTPYSTFGSNSGYSVISKIFSEEVFGFILVVAGVIQAAGTLSGIKRFRKVSIFLSLMIWIFIDAAFWLSGSPTTGTVGYLVIVLMLAWSL